MKLISTKKLICLALIGIFCLSFVVITPKPAQAYGMDAVFRDMGFGLLIGGVMGALILATNASHQTSEDWGRGIAIGAVAGAAIGLGIGMASTYKVALINVNRSEGVALAFPTIKPDLLTGKTSLDLLAAHF